MKAIVAGLIVVALLAAGGTAFFVKRFLSTQKQAPVAVIEKPVAKTYVLVANSNLPVGHKVTSGSLRWQEWSETGVHKSFVVSANRDDKLKAPLADTVVRRGISEGTPVTHAMVAKRGEAGFLAVAIDPSKVAVGIAVTAVTGSGGFIQPGDRVDVILTHDVSKGLPKSSASEESAQTDVLAKWASETVVTNVRVLAIDQKFSDFEDKAVVAKTATLEASPKEAQTLALAASMGALSLALRSLASGDEGSATKAVGAPFTTDVEISAALATALKKSAAETEAKEKSKAKDASQKAETTRVKVYKGGQGTTQEFSGR